MHRRLARSVANQDDLPWDARETADPARLAAPRQDGLRPTDLRPPPLNPYHGVMRNVDPGYEALLQSTLADLTVMGVNS